MIRLALALLSLTSSVGAQVIAMREPHHHRVFEDATIRVLRVRVPAHDTTLLHQHDPDYFWISLGQSTIVNAKLGAPEATVTSPDLSIHYAAGKFAHIARNPGAAPFDNITVELLKAQSGVRNLCDSVSAGPLNCSAKTTALLSGATEHPSFETKQLRVSLVTVAPGQTMKPATAAGTTWIIALDTLDTKTTKSLSVDAGGKWLGGTFQPASQAWSLTNHSPRAIRALAIVATTPR